MACPRLDFHIHTKHLGCANATMEVAAILAECRRLGVTSLGITDHLDRFESLGLHEAIRNEIVSADPGIRVYFGAELNFRWCDGPFAYSDEVREQYGFQFAIGGIHSSYLDAYDPEKLFEVQHRHHLKVCQDRLVDVLVHPYWFSGREYEKPGWPRPWTVKRVPESLTRELGQTARDTNTAIEINACANLHAEWYGQEYVRHYMDYLAVLADEGVCFAVGSDAHDIGRLAAVRMAWDAAEQLGLSEERIWHPTCHPLVGPPLP